MGVLALIGTAYVWVLYKRKKCRCRLCRGDYKLGNCIGSGGFGEVFIVTAEKKATWTEGIAEIYGNFWHKDDEDGQTQNDTNATKKTKGAKKAKKHISQQEVKSEQQDC